MYVLVWPVSMGVPICTDRDRWTLMALVPKSLSWLHKSCKEKRWIDLNKVWKKCTQRNYSSHRGGIFMQWQHWGRQASTDLTWILIKITRDRSKVFVLSLSGKENHRSWISGAKVLPPIHLIPFLALLNGVKVWTFGFTQNGLNSSFGWTLQRNMARRGRDFGFEFLRERTWQGLRKLQHPRMCTLYVTVWETEWAECLPCQKLTSCGFPDSSRWRCLKFDAAPQISHVAFICTQMPTRSVGFF